jgi:hypothetical protein
MPNKYAIIFPACHGGNFLGELLTLGEDCYSCDASLLESTLTDRFAAGITRYTDPGDWIAYEGKISCFRLAHCEELAKVDVIQAHIYNIKLSNDFNIVVADAFSNSIGVRWAETSRYNLFSNRYGLHHDEDKNYNILKNSKLPMLHVDMTQFLNHTFPVAYYEFLCQQLGIVPVTASAIQLHSVWHQHRVTPNQECPGISDSLRQNWSRSLQIATQFKFCLQQRNQNSKWFPKFHDHTELAIKHGYPADPYYQYTNVVPNLLFIEQNKI